MTSINQDNYLFSSSQLEKLSDWDEIKTQLAFQNLMARPLKLSDYDNGYLDLLNELTVVGIISKESFEQRFKEMMRCNEVLEQYMVVVIEDKATGRVIGASTLFLELKFIRQCSIRGRLEDVCVLDSHRGRNIGNLVIKIIIQLAREVHNCYKLTLDCTENLIGFYRKAGFERNAIQMSTKY